MVGHHYLKSLTLYCFMLDNLDGDKVKLDELDVQFIPNPRCKICRSPYVHEINQMLIEGRPYSEIIAKFKDKIPGLNKQNISNHKKHFNFVRKGIEKYYEQLEQGAEKVVDSIKALDEIIERSLRFIRVIDPTQKPRAWEVTTRSLIGAAKLKHQIVGDYDEISEEDLKEIFGQNDIEEVEE